MDSLKIRQLEAAVKLKKIRLGTGKCTKEELQAAEEALLKAKSTIPSPAGEKTTAPTKPIKKASSVRTEDLPLSDRQRTLLEIKTLRTERDELSNSLQNIPPGQNCEKLTLKIVTLTKEIESKWTIYKHGISKPAIEESELIEPEELIRLKDDRRKFGDERRKLNWKLRQKGQKRHLIEKWTLRLAELNSIIPDLDEKIRIVKNQ